TITVLDSLQRPCAERIFFAHYDRRVKMDIVTNSSDYTTRQKVELKLKMNSQALDTLKGMVSIACVQSNRMEIRKANDIESYVYLMNELENMPVKVNYMGQTPDDRAYLENILLIKGWRRYKWQDIYNANAIDTTLAMSRMILGGCVKRGKFELKEPTPLMIRNDSIVKVIQTDNNGRFELEDHYIMTDLNKSVILQLNGKDLDEQIVLNKDFEKVNDQLIDSFIPYYYYVRQDAQNDIIDGFERAINLKTVVIKGTKDDDFKPTSFFNSYGSNACGDYVCYKNVLNCQYHFNNPLNRPPKKGEKYFIETQRVNPKTMQKTFKSNDQYSEIYYTGCTIPNNGQSAIAISGIKYSKEFYGEDYSIINPSQPEYQSTIFWKHACYINSKEETSLSFYTSDITGPFKIIIQGITNNDVIYGEKEFNVKKP
ncbi:MAG TPA: hypothetical protein VIM89_09140, partial [Mucilaginibacter sp.]